LGYLHGAHAALPHFLRQGHGVLINVVSLAGWAPTPMASTYSASKFAVRGLFEGLRVELAGRPGIKICDLSPAFVDTPMIDHIGNYAGRAPRLVPPVIGADRVAAAIVGLARRPRDFQSLGLLFPLAVASHALSPRLFRALVGRAAHAYLGLARPAPISDGVLFRPTGRAGPTNVGRRSPALQALALVTISGLAAIAICHALRPARWSS
jgi:short-subunit dehydrogenase